MSKKGFNDENFFDRLAPLDMDEARKFQENAKAKGEKIDYLIHRTFAQTESGAELLEIWRESLLMAAVAEGGDDLIEIGTREGMNRFIRGIILTVRKVERNG